MWSSTDSYKKTRHFAIYISVDAADPDEITCPIIRGCVCYEHDVRINAQHAER